MIATIDTQARIDTFAAAVDAAYKLPIASVGPGPGGFTTRIQDEILLKDGTVAYEWSPCVAGTKLVPPSVPKILDPSLIQATAVPG